MKSEIEDDLDLKNIDLSNNDINSSNSYNDYNQFDNDFFVNIYKNNSLMADIIFNSLIGFDNLGVNCFFNFGLQIILHSYRFIDDINNITKKNIYQKYNNPKYFIDF